MALVQGRRRLAREPRDQQARSLVDHLDAVAGLPAVTSDVNGNMQLAAQSTDYIDTSARRVAEVQELELV